MGKVSLHGWPPVFKKWIQLLYYIQITKYFIFWTNPTLLNGRPAIQGSYSNGECSLATLSTLPWQMILARCHDYLNRLGGDVGLTAGNPAINMLLKKERERNRL